MFQLPVNNLTRLRKARKRVKRLLSDIGLDYCKEHVEDYKAFGPDEFYMKHFYLDVCVWDPSWTKSQDYRTKQFCCSDCPFASKYFSAYKNHFRNVHRDDFENRILLNCSYCMYSGNKRTLETHVRLFHMPYNIARQGLASSLETTVSGKDSIRMDKSMLTDRKEVAVYYCKKCNYRDRLYNVVRRHIFREHFQHLTHYVAKTSEKPENNAEATMSNHGIHCNRCLFVPRSYEALVQHVIEFHEHIGHQVTDMIGHANVTVSCSQASIIQRGASVTPGVTTHMVHPVNRYNVPQLMKVPVGNHFKQGLTGIPGQPLCITLPDKGLLSNQASQSYPGKHLGSVVATSKHQSSKFLPFSSGHVEKEHQLYRVQVMAKYIMKIHTFTSKCLYCNRYLASDTLLNHMLIHGLTCPQCQSTFYEVEKIFIHKRRMHPNEPGNFPTDSALTFDLTLQQGSPKNVQLIVTTYNIKEVPKSSYTAVQPPNSMVTRSTIAAAKGPNRPSKSLMRIARQNVVPQNKEIGKTICPLCFTILKGPISDALAQHLQDQHQVLHTFHPVEKKSTYKCIHCFAVYTGNMTASKITLHLVHCRGHGQAPKVNDKKCISALKREIVTFDTFDNKKKKMVAQSRHYPTTFVEKPAEPILILDPRGHAGETYDARKAFLTTYFNQQPYPSQREVEKLAASLWLWKSDVLSHFANQRRSCELDFVIRKPLVLLGFNMQAVNQLKHEMYFDCKWLFKVNNEQESGNSRTTKKRSMAVSDFSTNKRPSPHIMEALNAGQYNQSSCAFTSSAGSSAPIDSYEESKQEEVSINNRTLKTTSTFSSVVQTWTKEALLQERFLYKRPGMVASTDFTEGGSKCLDGYVSGPRTQEATWSGSITPNDRLYRTTGRFEEKGQEIGLLGT